jgi:multicomponent Na+:H+ antiporter subunit E
MARLQIALPIFLVYLALSTRPASQMGEHPHWPNLVFGALVAYSVSLFLPARSQPFRWSRFFSFLFGLFRYTLFVIVDMFKSAIQTARIVLDPKLPIAPGIIAIDSGCQSELATALSAHAITITPGEMVIAMDEKGVMYTHTLNVQRSAEAAEEVQALRRDLLSKIFE